MKQSSDGADVLLKYDQNKTDAEERGMSYYANIVRLEKHQNNFRGSLNVYFELANRNSSYVFVTILS